MQGIKPASAARLFGMVAVSVLAMPGQAGAQLSGTSREFGTRDLGEIHVGCDRFAFIVSYNDDDDNANRRPDRRDAIAPAAEDNLRQFTFDHPGAAHVFIAAPVRVSDNAPAIPGRIRAYQADKTTAFDFNARHPVPVTMYFEGVGISSARNDLGFEYQYFHADGTTLCGGGPNGTVIDVNARLRIRAGGGASFDDHRKMLITGRGDATAAISPRSPGTVHWLYVGDASLATPDQLATEFTAGLVFTPVPLIDQTLLVFELREGSQAIQARHPVNLTAPLHLESQATGFDHMTPDWLNPGGGGFDLMPRVRIGYRILDQQHHPIRDSAYAGRRPQVRENIGRVLTSPIPSVVAWMSRLKWARWWRSKSDGTFVDRIEATGVPRAPFLVQQPGGAVFHPTLQANGGILMNVPPPATHQWELSVDGSGIAVGTQNSFQSVVAETRQVVGRTQIKVRSRYSVVTP